MKFIWSSLLLVAAPAFACGPFFPNTVLDQPGESLRAPTFAFDLTGILPVNSVWRYNGVPLCADGDFPEYWQGWSLLGKDDDAATHFFRRARETKASRTNNVGAASIGWEARAELNRGHLIRAGELYVEHFATGDPTALMSLRTVAGKILAADAATLRAAARHPQLSRVITVYLAARGGPFCAAPPKELASAWLAAVEATGTVNLDCADRLAWGAYHAGEFELAKRWLVRATKQSASTGWLRTKLLLRDGQTEAAYRQLAESIRSFPATNDWPNASKNSLSDARDEVDNALGQAQGELAFLQLSRREYIESLHLLLQAGYWSDAAYVAERVVTVDELTRYAVTCTNTDLHYLLGRRLVRLGRYVEARPHLPNELLPKLDDLAATVSKQDAPTLWQAAQTMCHFGMELTGTELEPDWSIYGGSYVSVYGIANRLAMATTAEQLRAKDSASTPAKRFHYRYLAADLAWQAASLMPDNSDETARVLCAAGTWLKYLDPQAADRFYKALVRRCRKTALGQEADRLRWFPKLTVQQ